MSRYNLIRFHLSLSSFAGIVFGASHYWCKLRWVDEHGEEHEADAEHGRGDAKEMRFATEQAARSAGLRLAKRLAAGSYYVVTEGTHNHLDPGPTRSAPGNLKERLNKLYRDFEALDGWNAPKEKHAELERISDRWTLLAGGHKEKPRARR